MRIIIALCFIGCAAELQAASDQWQYPMANWVYVRTGGFGFGETNEYFPGYHCAQDTNVSRTPVGTPVYAAADGVVKFAGLVGGYGSIPCNGRPGAAGYVVVIEHTFSNGSKACTTSGHVKGGTYNPNLKTGLVPVGTVVTRGQYIAQVASYGGCPSGDWHHLHFGIRNGAYAGATNLAGYVSWGELQNWNEPTAYIDAHPGSSEPTCNDPGSFIHILKGGDYNGDGKKDLCRYYSAVGRWDIALSTGTSFAPFQQWKCQHGIGSTDHYVGDINGDGKTDTLVFFGQYGDAYIATSYGAGFNNYYKANQQPILMGMTNKFFEDINGDGKDDLIGYYHGNGNWYVSLSNGTHLGPSYVAYQGHGVGSSDRLTGDVNGDGRIDAIAVWRQSGYGWWYVALGQPDGSFGWAHKWAEGHGVGATQPFLGDINGDNIDDAFAFWNMLGSTPGVWIVWNGYPWASKFWTENAWRAQGESYNATDRIVADFTGDGGADIASYWSGVGWYVAVTDGIYYRRGVPW
jgi:hypothetical protein